ncbi:MAG: caspase family protein [Microscillaceae bacterium]|nr:caspase family protein [Microscillaceae bacterium]
MKKIALAQILFWLICLVAPLSLTAQSLYEISFVASEVTYTGFLVYFNEEDAYMRVGYEIDGNYNVVEVKYTSVTGQEDDYNYQVMIGRDPVFITEQGDQAYNPDHFVWVWNDETENELPFVTDDPAFDENSMIQCSSFTEIDPKSLNDEFLQQFFFTDEPQYLALKKMAAYKPSTPATQTNTNTSTNTAAKMHLVLFINSEIGDIGQSCSADQRTVEIEFREISKAVGIPFEKYVVNGENFTKAKAQQTLNQINAGVNDIVVFYYSGHGFRWSDQSDKFPQLDMRYSEYTPLGNETALPLTEVSKSIESRGARLNILLSDCCNSDVGRNQMTSTTFMAGRSFQGAEIEKLKALFLNSKGSLVFSGSSPSEYSWCNQNGGFFTLSFIQALKEEIGYLRSNVPSWNNIVEHTVRSTQSKAKSCQGCQPQNPIYNLRITQK